MIRLAFGGRDVIKWWWWRHRMVHEQQGPFGLLVSDEESKSVSRCMGVLSETNQKFPPFNRNSQQYINLGTAPNSKTGGK